MNDLSYTYRVKREGSLYRGSCIEFPDTVEYAAMPDQALLLIKKKISNIIQYNQEKGLDIPIPS